MDVLERAKSKLNRIITLFGDDNGKRLKDSYLDALIAEEVLFDLIRKEISCLSNLQYR